MRGFVAIGRRMSITHAALDLCLTQSAVSRQIQNLKDALGVRLFVREHRGLDMPLDAAAQLGADTFGLVAASDDFPEGTRAFLEKRSRIWCGR